MALKNDGLYLPTIKAHSREKFQLHSYYARMFATATKKRWPQRAYLGLYSGAGRARVGETGDLVETTAISVFGLPDPFTKYIFADRDPRCTEALEARIRAVAGGHDFSVITGDINTASVRGEIVEQLPRFSKDHGLISFCFLDPFAADLEFDTIRVLGRFKMDFLVLLALGSDARRNFRHYYATPSDTRIAKLIDCPTWREEFDPRRESVVRFILRKFDLAMTGLGYLPAKPGHYRPVKVRGTGVMQYILVLYSKNPLGQAFWGRTVEGTDPQLDLGLMP